MDLIEEFSEGRIQFAFCKVKDPNSGLPKSALIAWVRKRRVRRNQSSNPRQCGEGVPERTKGYFTSHLNAVSKLLHVSRSFRGLVFLLTCTGLPRPNHRAI